ncbi:LacI family DNA-binding transcriptional regulator [Winogradskyella schleiferi]|uniref:LacI family DNA-binding transcriptional regulator n=1 Tax=Winogradskyella schleiferi TaxID=2686078 RepID=UPI0015C17193|nr:substrate-binding domain-containing protein [Winogradskyella schleiferi]
MAKKILLKDIAKKANVSVATVSYVLSKGSDSGISPKVSEKIKKIAKALNYRPNQIAKSLQSGKSYTIGLIVADISNPFFANIARIIEDEAKKHNYTVVFGSSDENETKSSDLITFLVNRQVDGFIIAPAENTQEQIKSLKKQNIPFVLIDRYFPEIDTNYVAINNHKATFDATKKLLASGHNAIGLIAYESELHHMKERIRGYREAIENKGLETHDNYIKKVKFSNLVDDINAKVDELLISENPVSAILYTTNTLAIHGLKRIDALKLKVPKDVSVIVFDAAEAFDFYYCPLTYVKQPLMEIGKNAVTILLDQIANPNHELSKMTLETTLVNRESSN